MHASRHPVEAAMKLGGQTPPAADDSPRVGPEDLVRAVLDFQRGADREKSFELLFRRFRPRVERFLAPRVFSPEERLDLTKTSRKEMHRKPIPLALLAAFLLSAPAVYAQCPVGQFYLDLNNCTTAPLAAADHGALRGNRRAFLQAGRKE